MKVGADGRLLINGRPLDLRGVGLQEDSRTRGFAIDNATRDQQLGWVRELGASLIRAHYPLHPYTLERADELGLLVWSEIPVYQVETEELQKTEVRDAAVRVLQDSVIANRDHPSILLWSIGNELSARPGPIQASYIARAERRGEGARPDAARRRWPSPPRRRSAARRSTARSTCSASTTTSAGTRARTAASPTATCSRRTSTSCAPATRRRR